MKLLKRLLQLQGGKTKRGTVDHNAHRMRKKYPLSKGGYFGEKGDNKRVVHAENQIKESKKFYTQVSRGGKNKPMSNGRGSQKIMKDGGVVTYREKNVNTK